MVGTGLTTLTTERYNRRAKLPVRRIQGFAVGDDQLRRAVTSATVPSVFLRTGLAAGIALAVIWTADQLDIENNIVMAACIATMLVHGVAGVIWSFYSIWFVRRPGAFVKRIGSWRGDVDLMIITIVSVVSAVCAALIMVSTGWL